MANYLEIPSQHVDQVKQKFTNWFAIEPIETADNRWVIPVQALKAMRDEILPILKDQINIDKLIAARDYLENRTVLNDSVITWKEWDIEGNRIN